MESKTAGKLGETTVQAREKQKIQIFSGQMIICEQPYWGGVVHLKICMKLH